jgi:hypothetical protein
MLEQNGRAKNVKKITPKKLWCGENRKFPNFPKNGKLGARGNDIDHGFCLCSNDEGAVTPLLLYTHGRGKDDTKERQGTHRQTSSHTAANTTVAKTAIH